VTPPGHLTNIAAATTTKCAAGSYRADWKPASAAASCVACGANIFTNEVDQVAVYKIDTLEAANPETVAASAAACCEYNHISCMLCLCGIHLHAAVLAALYASMPSSGVHVQFGAERCKNLC
jgi:hypothetical protein